MPTTEAADSSLAVRQLEDFLLVGDGFLRTWRLVKQVEVEFVIAGHTSHRLIRIFKTPGIGADPDGCKAETRQRREREPGLADEICSQSDPEEEWIFARQPGPPFIGMAKPEYAALQRVDALQQMHGRELIEKFDQTAHSNSGSSGSPQQYLHVIRRVVNRPGFVIDACPLAHRHERMRRADMFEIVIVEIGIHRDAG